MGKSRTLVYQIGRLYFLKGEYYTAVKESKGIVTFEGATTFGTITRKQRYR
jgi:hypothetical protein